MIRRLKAILGVTLLEIMLVLAIASMVILMSVKFYKSATSAEQATAFLSQIQTIVAAADTYAQGSTGYSGLSLAVIQGMLGGTTATATPWGQFSSVGGDQTGFSVVYPGGASATVTTAVAAQLTANPRFTSSTTAGFTYNSTK